MNRQLIRPLLIVPLGILLSWPGVEVYAENCSPLVVLYGGADSSSSSGSSKGLFDYCQDDYKPPSGVRKRCEEWGGWRWMNWLWVWRQTRSIREYWSSNGEPPVVLVGHSYGGDSAYEVARDLGDDIARTLITLDPVSSRTTTNGDKIPKPNVRKWTNVYVDPDRGSGCGVVSWLGQGWRSQTNADRNILSSKNHCSVRHMLSLVQSDIDDAAVCQAKAKQGRHEIWMAETRVAASVRSTTGSNATKTSTPKPPRAWRVNREQLLRTGRTCARPT